MVCALAISLASACDNENTFQGRTPVPGTTPTGAQTITITATDHKYTPNQITATAGASLTIILQNQGTQPHSIDFALPGGEVALPSPIPAGSTATLAVTAPTAPGNYFCPVDAHRDLGMTGTLGVLAAAAIGPEAGAAPREAGAAVRIDSGTTTTPLPTPTPNPAPAPDS